MRYTNTGRAEMLGRLKCLICAGERSTAWSLLQSAEAFGELPDLDVDRVAAAMVEDDAEAVCVIDDILREARYNG
jgi:hypothetical protein